MNINLPLVLLVLFAVAILLMLVWKKNKKDRIELKDKLNQDYHKPKKHDDAGEIEDKE